MIKKYQLGFSDKSYKFKVGHEETHSVEVRAGGIVGTKIDIFVDGRHVGIAVE